MAMCGSRCENKINENDSLKCAVCGIMFHQECVNLQKQLSKSIVSWKTPNVQYRCDKCVENDQIIKKMFEKLSSEMMKNEKNATERHLEVMRKIDNIEKSLNANGKKVIDEIAKVVEEGKNESEASWVEVLNKKKTKSLKKNDPVVVITPKDKDQNRATTKKLVKSTIDTSNIIVRGISHASNNGIVIRCESDKEREMIITEAVEKLGENYEVKKPKMRLPRFKILKVNEPDEDDDKFINDLKRRNSIIADDKCKFNVIKREQVRIRGKIVDDQFNMVIETDGETFKKIMTEKKLLTPWKTCKVVDNVYILRCFKCYGFNHTSKDCNAPVACARCGLDHIKDECKSSDEKCVNCMSANQRLKINLPVNHNVWSRDCSVYKRKIEMSKRAISYVE